ncbi:hypothetical protein [Acidovorax sp. Leaf160]|uniref:hypothetical protein n=1 Tax=Acidovorax sp. Leaf160 TaxID=1736280 RepID=UPI0006F7B282|nr:hypothetical protein [Acidovorax sp. Leaf160]KQR55651.1 hypothetical protein ASF94_04430 [Acidovorax sp. Leaf160]
MIANKPTAAAVLAQAQAASAALQAAIKAANHAADSTPLAFRQRAAEKEASAQHLLRAYEQRCKTYPHTRFTAPVVALWEGHFALREQASALLAQADRAEANAAGGSAAPAIHTLTHRATAAA